MYQNVVEYLSGRSIPYKTTTDQAEVMIKCLFCDDRKTHLYVNNKKGCYFCHHCGAKGSWINFTEKLGDTTSPQLEGMSTVEYRAYLKNPAPDEDLPDKFQKQLPDRIREYLKSEARGLTDETISKFKLGWNGKRITIPVFDKQGKLINIRYRRSPGRSKGPKMLSKKGSKASLFNIRVLSENKSFVVITEGEFDAIIAVQNGFPAVSGTAGATTFKEEWVKEFADINAVYICYDTDEAGEKGAKQVAELLGQKARIIKLPSHEGGKVDLSDYFTKLKQKPEDFQKLLDLAKPIEEITSELEIIDKKINLNIHPALDFYEGKLYLSLLLPIRIDRKEDVKRVLLSSDRERSVISKDKAKIAKELIHLRKVSNISGEQVRWNSKQVQQYLASEKNLSLALPFIEIRETLQKYIDFRKEKDTDILTLWLMGTYCFPIFDAFPYLYFIGVKRSGKTKTLLLIEKLAFNAILSSNISPAVLFRFVETKRCTLALDEGEQLSDKTRKQELRELLNAGYKQGSPAYRVNKNKKGGFEIEAFEVYSPKAIANISGLDDVLEDRAITITMVRTTNPTKGNIAVTDSAEDWNYLRSLLYCFALENSKNISEVYNEDPEVNALLNRQNELWRPLLTIAKVIEPEFQGLFEDLKKEAVRRAEETSSTDLADFDSAVLLALREFVSEEEEVSLTNKEIKEKAHEFLEEDQREYLTSRGIGAALKRFGIRGKKIRGYWNYYSNPETIKDLLNRYGVEAEW